jgi:putative membrane protein
MEWINFSPSIWGGIGLLVSGYLGAIGPFQRRFKGAKPVRPLQAAWFLSGALVLLIALASPLDELGDRYLFSAHMIQHMLLALIAPPLLLLGTPDWLARPVLHFNFIRKVAKVLTSPLAAYFLFNLIFLGWHIPALYELTLQNETIHIFEHLLFIFTGLLNWWPILSPLPELPRLSPPAQLLYLFLEGIPCTILGAVIVFASGILIPSYASAPSIFGLNPITDQQIAGLAMAMPGGMVYLGAMSAVFYRWLKEEDNSNRNKILRQVPSKINLTDE